jgi:hypothetical protein
VFVCVVFVRACVRASGALDSNCWEWSHCVCLCCVWACVRASGVLDSNCWEWSHCVFLEKCNFNKVQELVF